jgi:hypothetical protein
MTILILRDSSPVTSPNRIFGYRFAHYNLLDLPQLLVYPPTHLESVISKLGPTTVLAIIPVDLLNQEVSSSIWKSVATIKHGELLPSDRLNSWLSQSWLTQDLPKYIQNLAESLDLLAYRQHLNIAFRDITTRRLYLIGYRKAFHSLWRWLSDDAFQAVINQNGSGIHSEEMIHEVASLFMLNDAYIATPHHPRTMEAPDQVFLILNATPFAPDQLPEMVQLLGLTDPKHGYHAITTCSIADSWDAITQLEFYLLDLLDRCHTSEVHDNLYLIVVKPEDIGPLEDQLAISEVYLQLFNHPNFHGHVIPIVVKPPF